MSTDEQAEGQREVANIPQDINIQSRFALFPKLPPELRRMIWLSARPNPQTVTTCFIPYNQFRRRRNNKKRDLDEQKTYSKFPKVLHSNHEARAVSLESYQICFKDKFTAPFYFDYDRDTLKLCGFNTFMTFFYYQFSWTAEDCRNMSRLQTLEFDKDLTFWLLDELDSELVLERFDFHRFKSLKLLTLQIWDAIGQNERDILAALLRQRL
jgi:hypothetical protein